MAQLMIHLAINSARELETARRQPRSIVFLAVDWAMQSRKSAFEVSELAERLAIDLKLSVPIYVVNVSKQEGELWNAVRQWLQSEGQNNADQLTFGGCGALVWSANGTIVASVPYAAGLGLEKLVTVTKNVFDES